LRRFGLKRVTPLLLVFACGIAWWIAGRAANLLVVDDRQPADAILVLAGETEARPALALDLLRQQYAPRIILNVPARAHVYQWAQSELAQHYLDSIAPRAATVCPIEGLSTRDEARDAGRCLQALGARRVLIVTSDFHTRRARSVLRHELPQFKFSIAAARDQRIFGTPWYHHRQWAKTFFDESIRLVWWYAVDRWRS
jgi:uncharacterized SAM-binding protein YcdF (DUF218 family)